MKSLQQITEKNEGLQQIHNKSKKVECGPDARAEHPRPPGCCCCSWWWWRYRYVCVFACVAAGSSGSSSAQSQLSAVIVNTRTTWRANPLVADDWWLMTLRRPENQLCRTESLIASYTHAAITQHLSTAGSS